MYNGGFQILTAVIHKSRTDLVEILQGPSYKACPTVSPIFFAFGLFVLVSEISAFTLRFLNLYFYKMLIHSTKITMLVLYV